MFCSFYKIFNARNSWLKNSTLIIKNFNIFYKKKQKKFSFIKIILSRMLNHQNNCVIEKISLNTYPHSLYNS